MWVLASHRVDVRCSGRRGLLECHGAQSHEKPPREPPCPGHVGSPAHTTPYREPSRRHETLLENVAGKALVDGKDRVRAAAGHTSTQVHVETRWWRPNLKTPKTPPKPHPHRPPCHHTDRHDQGQPPPNILQYVLLSAQSIGSGSYLWCTMRGSTGTEGCDRRQSATQVRQAWPARQLGHPLPHQGLPPTSSLHCTITHDHMQAQRPVAPGAHV